MWYQLTEESTWPWQFTRSLCSLLIQHFSIPVVEETPWICQILALPGPVVCGLPCSIGVDQFAQTCVLLSFKEMFLYIPELVLVTKVIFQPWLFMESPTSSYYGIFLSQRLVKPLGFVKFWMSTPSPLSNALLCWSWSMFRNVCGIEVWKKLSCTSLIRYQSSENILASIVYWVSHHFCLIWYVLTPMVDKTP